MRVVSRVMLLRDKNFLMLLLIRKLVVEKLSELCVNAHLEIVLVG